MQQEHCIGAARRENGLKMSLLYAAGYVYVDLIPIASSERDGVHFVCDSVDSTSSRGKTQK
jgi:hypothetical protein